MCGVVAFLSADSHAITRFEDIAEALRCLDHRGPDDRGVWCDRDVVLAFTRLEIIDADGSPQPMPYADGRYRIVFNGEIYNYLELRAELARDFGAVFLTDGDTESILAAYHYRLESGTCFTVVDGKLATRRYFEPDFAVSPARTAAQRDDLEDPDLVADAGSAGRSRARPGPTARGGLGVSTGRASAGIGGWPSGRSPARHRRRSVSALPTPRTCRRSASPSTSRCPTNPG